MVMHSLRIVVEVRRGTSAGCARAGSARTCSSAPISTSMRAALLLELGQPPALLAQRFLARAMSASWDCFCASSSAVCALTCSRSCCKRLDLGRAIPGSRTPPAPCGRRTERQLAAPLLDHLGQFAQCAARAIAAAAGARRTSAPPRPAPPGSRSVRRSAASRCWRSSSSSSGQCRDLRLASSVRGLSNSPARATRAGALLQPSCSCAARLWIS